MSPVTRTKYKKREREEREREQVLERDSHIANENLFFYKRRLDNIHKNPDVNSRYLKDEPWIENFNGRVVDYWSDIFTFNI
jgi:hypothetical protein